MSRVFVTVMGFLLLQVGARAGELIFEDGFESGDLTAWSSSVGGSTPCVFGLAHGTALAGDLGPAPGGAFQRIACLEIRNDRPFPRTEFAISSIPLPASLAMTSPDALALIGPGNRRLAAQFDVISRWGGIVNDASRAIRWLQITVPAPVAAGDSASYELRSYDSLPTPTDAYAVDIVALGGGAYDVDTGLATFSLDATNPALFSAIAIDEDDDGTGGRTTIYAHSAGAGPRLVFDDAGSPVTLSTVNPAEVQVDPGTFDIVESGPVRVVVRMKGHFTGGGDSRCNSAGVAAYDRFGFTTIAIFDRASRHVRLQIQFRNECSDAFSEPWTDEVAAVHEMTWELPFTLTDPDRYFAGQGAVTSAAAATQVEVEQRRGSDPGSGWTRRAEVRLDGALQTAENAETYEAPQVGIADAVVVIAAQMPWMRYREPQALAIDDTTLSLAFVSGDPTADPVFIGEGKGIWNSAKIALFPTTLIAGSVPALLESERQAAQSELERGLLVRAPLDLVNASQILPGLGNGSSSTIKTTYEAWMVMLHDETVDPGGQWDRGKTYGSQYWPETASSDPFSVDWDTPNEGRAGMNYWDPAGAELLEYLRTGDPKWIWDFALPGYWTQMFAEYMNIGDHNHGNRNGVAVQSGGPGCPFDNTCTIVTVCTPDGTAGGHWGRSDCGSDDYMYDMSIELAYALRPHPAMRDRFAQAGRMIVGRYSIPRSAQSSREIFVNQVDITRGVIQHFEMLANCAEFVPGNGIAGDGIGGDDCHERLVGFVDLGDLGVVGELTLDNLAAGIMCQGDDVTFTPPDSCFTPQQFMQNALMYLFFHRVYRNYGDPQGAPAGALLRALVDGPVHLYNDGIARNGAAINVDEAWAEGLECTLDATGTSVVSCQDVDPDPDSVLLGHNKPHTVGQLLMAHELDPTVGLCQIAKDALGNPDITLGWGDHHFNQAGWWKGVSQQMQAMAYTVGIYDTCQDLP